MSEIDIADKVKAVEALDDHTQNEVADMYGVSRRTIINWRDRVDEYRAELKDREFHSKVDVLDGKLGAVSQHEKAYLDKLESLGSLEDRKQVFVSGLEKVMWDHLGKLDGQVNDDIKATDRVKMLKDMNEIREKLAGEPSVIMEYRAKFQIAVMEVVRDMIPDRAEEFLTRVKMVEND